MGRPRKTLTTLETLTPEQVAEANAPQKALDMMVAEGEALGLYEEPVTYVTLPKDGELVQLVQLNNIALSIVRNPVTQHWILLQFKFDYVTKTVGELTILDEHTDRIEIVERFKMVAGTELMSAV